MATINAWRQSRLIHRPGVGELVEWSKGYRADNESPRHNRDNRDSTLAQDLGEDFQNGYIYENQSVDAPSLAPTASLAGLGSGHVPKGTHSYALTFVTRYGETDLSPVATASVIDGAVNGKVSLSGLSVSLSPVVLARRLYRAVVSPLGEVRDYRLLVELGAAGETYLDNAGAKALGDNPPTRNTTHPVIVIHGFKTTMESIDSGGIPIMLRVGNSRATFMPSECNLARGDRLRLLEPARREVAREVLRRGTGSMDRLSFGPVSEIVRVLQRDERVADFIVGTDCRVDASKRCIEWLAGGNAPPVGEHYSIEWLYHPTMWFLNEEASNSHPTHTGEGGFRTGRLVMRHPENLAAATAG